MRLSRGLSGVEIAVGNLEFGIQDLEFRIELRQRRVRMTNVDYVRGTKSQPGQERCRVVGNGFHRNVFVPTLPGAA